MDPSVSRRALLKTAAASLALGVDLDPEESEAQQAIPRRVLGKTGVRVPILGFGTAAAGIRRNVENAGALYNEALDLGLNYFDTAPTHTGYGIAQKQLGHVVRKRRKEMFLVTKCAESGGEAALRLLRRNLKELQTDRADLVYV